MNSIVYGLEIARLILWLDMQGMGVFPAYPAANKFLHAKPSPESELKEYQVKTTINTGSLLLRLRLGSLIKVDEWGTPLLRTDNCIIWQDAIGRMLLSAPRETPPVSVIIDVDFKNGELLLDDSAVDGKIPDPFQFLGIRIYINWLARYYDFILHASGVIINENGYCFVGPSGAGKSTLCSSLSGKDGITVLGEDQIILRYIDGQFWIFGTPWHENPALCSPRGAPLEMLFFLDNGNGDRVTPFPPLMGITHLLQDGFLPYYRPEYMPGILERMALLSEEIPFYSLSYNLDSDALQLILNA